MRGTTGGRVWGRAWLAGLLLAAPSARASDVPPLIATQGVLRQNAGGLQSGTFQLTFRIYDQTTVGTLLYQEVKTLNLDNGMFTAVIGQVPLGTPPLDPVIFKDHNELWLGVEVENDPGGELPRVRFTSTPYAFQARHADNADQCVAATQAEVADDASKLGGIPASLYPRSFSAADGPLKLSYMEGSTARVVDFTPSACAEQSVLKRVGGTWVCLPDQDTTYTGSGGIVVSGTSISIGVAGVQSGNLNTGSVLADAIASGAVGSDEIADGTIVNADVATRTLTGDRLVVGTVGSTEIADQGVTNADIRAGEITEDRIATATRIPASKLDNSLALTTAANTFFSAQTFNLGFSTGGSSSTQIGGTLTTQGNATFTSPVTFNGGAAFATGTTATFTGSAVFNGQATFNGTTAVPQLRTSDIRDSSSVTMGTGLAASPVNALRVAAAGTTLMEGSNTVVLHPSSASAQFHFPGNLSALGWHLVATDNQGRSQWAPLNVTSADIANGTVAGQDMVNGAVDTAQLADGAVGNAKIATGVITEDRLSSATRIPAAKLDSALAAKDVINTFTALQTMSGGLTVPGGATATLSGPVNVAGLTTVTGVTALNGATTFGTTSTFTGAATFNGTATLNGAATLAAAGTALTVTNNATVGGTLSVATITSTGAVDVTAGGSTLSVDASGATLASSAGRVVLVPPTASTTFEFPGTDGADGDILTGKGGGVAVWRTPQAPQQLVSTTPQSVTAASVNAFGVLAPNALSGVSGGAVVTFTAAVTCPALVTNTVTVDIVKVTLPSTTTNYPAMPRTVTVPVNSTVSVTTSEYITGVLPAEEIRVMVSGTAANTCSIGNRSLVVQPWW